MLEINKEISKLISEYKKYNQDISAYGLKPEIRQKELWDEFIKNLEFLHKIEKDHPQDYSLIHQLHYIKQPVGMSAVESTQEPNGTKTTTILYSVPQFLEILSEAATSLNYKRLKLIRLFWQHHNHSYIDTEVNDTDMLRAVFRNARLNANIKGIKVRITCNTQYTELRYLIIDTLCNTKQLFSIELSGHITFDEDTSTNYIFEDELKGIPHKNPFFIKISNKDYNTKNQIGMIVLDENWEPEKINIFWRVMCINRNPGSSIQIRVVGDHNEALYEKSGAILQLQLLSDLTNEELNQDTGNLPYIFRAAQQNDLMCLQYLLNRGIAFNRACKVTDPDTEFTQHFNIIHIASLHADSNILELLSTLEGANGLLSTKFQYMTSSGLKQLNALEATLHFREENVLEIVKSLFSFFNIEGIEENLIDIALKRRLYDVVICLLEQKALISKEATTIVTEISQVEDPDQDKQNLADYLKETLTPFQIIQDAGDESRIRALQEELGKLAKEYRISPETMIEAAKKEIKTKPINDFIQWHKEHPHRDINSYRDLENQSLLFCTYNKKAHSIYGYLLANGAKPANHETIGRASEEAFQPFKDATEHFFEQRIDITLFLASHTHISSSFKDPVDPVTLYQTLSKTSGGFAKAFILPILNVFRFVDADFKIMVDPNHETIAHLSGSAIKGRFMSRPYRVYVGSQNDRKLMQGTLIHELTHFACFIVYQNGCLPYKQEGEHDKETACNAIYDCMSDSESISHLDSNPYLTYFSKENFWEKYPEKETDQSGQEIGKLKRIKELIVRIPQTLLVYGQDGLEALQEHAPKLLEYYQSTFIPDCQKYVTTKEMEARTALIPSSPKRATLQPKATEESDVTHKGNESPSSTSEGGGGTKDKEW